MPLIHTDSCICADWHRTLSSNRANVVNTVEGHFGSQIFTGLGIDTFSRLGNVQCPSAGRARRTSGHSKNKPESIE